MVTSVAAGRSHTVRMNKYRSGRASLCEVLQVGGVF